MGVGGTAVDGTGVGGTGIGVSAEIVAIISITSLVGSRGDEDDVAGWAGSGGAASTTTSSVGGTDVGSICAVGVGGIAVAVGILVSVGCNVAVGGSVGKPANSRTLFTLSAPSMGSPDAIGRRNPSINNIPAKNTERSLTTTVGLYRLKDTGGVLCPL